MTPDEKLLLVEEFIKIGYHVGMCGDGANDCGALKAAHVGVSLSEAEASVAAPFTCLNATIACIPHVIREGRAALATSFQMFKYMACYSLLQYFTVICLYQINSNLGDYQFLFVDLFIILPTVLFMSRTEASRKLVRSKPPSSLISRSVFASLAWHLISAFIIQVCVMINVQQQQFYRPLATSPNTKDNIETYETTALFSINIFQTFGVALAYSISRPFKKPLLTNKIYTVVLIILIVILSYLVLVPDSTTMWILQLVDMPIMYKVRLFIIGILYLCMSYIFERFFIMGMLRSTLNIFSFRKLGYYFNKITKSNVNVNKSRKVYNLLRDGIKRIRTEEMNRRNDSVISIRNEQ
jgi:magnesium-transporting ATPase (P-type)